MNPRKPVKDSLLSLLGGLTLFSLSVHEVMAVGAVTPFTVVEAESGTLGGGAIIRAFTPGSAVPSAATLELEASGLALVELNATGESVSWDPLESTCRHASLSIL